MTRSRFPRRIAFVLVLATVLASPVLGAGLGAHGKARPASFAAFVLDLLEGLWMKGGCGIDPSGHCAPIQAKGGCGIDPDGRCRADGIAAPGPAEIGCGIDPDGRCLPGH